MSNDSFSQKMEPEGLAKLDIATKTGQEFFHQNGQPLPVRVLDFWRWSASDLLNNAMRGVLAEYIVACALGVAKGVGTEWDAYDVLTLEGIRIEVKSAAYSFGFNENFHLFNSASVRHAAGMIKRIHTKLT